MFIYWGIRQNTSPTQGGPKVERERSAHETETKQSQRMTENSKASHGCNSIRVNNEITREKQLDLRPSVDTQFSCDSRVNETTLWGSLGMVEGQDSFKLHYSEETDSDSSYYECEEGTQDCDLEEGSQETQSKSAYVNNMEAIKT